MSLRFLDSFDHYATANIPEKWTSSSSASVFIGTGNGRRSTNGLRITSSTSYVRKVMDAQPTWVCGWAYRFQSLGAFAATILEFRDSGALQVDVRVTTTGNVQITRNGTVLGTTTETLVLSTYNYLEFLATMHASAGVARLRINGIERLTLTGVNTQATGNASVNDIRVGNVDQFVSLGGTQDIDDWYLCDGTGATNNTFLGDCRVDCLFPVADGSASAWVPSTGTAHYALVDEATPNDDTDYLSTSTAAARDLHQFADLPVMETPVIFGVQHCLSARKDDAGTRQIKSLLKSGATTQVGATVQTLASTYTYYSEVWPVDPATGAAWTVAAVNGVEAGCENQ